MEQKYYLEVPVKNRIRNFQKKINKSSSSSIVTVNPSSSLGNQTSTVNNSSSFLNKENKSTKLAPTVNNSRLSNLSLTIIPSTNSTVTPSINNSSKKNSDKIVSIIVSHNSRIQCLLKELLKKDDIYQKIEFQNCAIIRLELEKDMSLSIKLVHEGELSNYKTINESSLKKILARFLKRKYYSINTNQTNPNIEKVLFEINDCEKDLKRYCNKLLECLCSIVSNKNKNKNTITDKNKYVFYIVRCGEGYHNTIQEKRLTKIYQTTLSYTAKIRNTNNGGLKDPILSDVGMIQSKNAGDKLFEILRHNGDLNIKYLFASDLVRTRMTMAMICERLLYHNSTKNNKLSKINITNSNGHEWIHATTFTKSNSPKLIVWSPDNKYIISCNIVDSNSFILILDSISGKILEYLPFESPINSIVWHPTSKYYCIVQQNNLDMYKWDQNNKKSVFLYSCDYITEFQNYNNPSNILSAAWSPNGKYIAIGFTNNKIIITNILSPNSNEYNNITLELDQNEKEIKSIVWNPTSDSIAYSSSNQKISIYKFTKSSDNRITNQNILQSIFPSNNFTDDKVKNDVNCIFWNLDGESILYCSTTNLLKTWNIKDKILEYKHKFIIYNLSNSMKTINFTIWSPDGAYVACNIEKTIYLCSIKSAKTLKFNIDEITSIACSPDGKYIAIGSSDGIRIYTNNSIDINVLPCSHEIDYNGKGSVCNGNKIVGYKGSGFENSHDSYYDKRTGIVKIKKKNIDRMIYGDNNNINLKINENNQIILSKIIFSSNWESYSDFYNGMRDYEIFTKKDRKHCRDTNMIQNVFNIIIDKSYFYQYTSELINILESSDYTILYDEIFKYYISLKNNSSSGIKILKKILQNFLEKNISIVLPLSFIKSIKYKEIVILPKTNFKKNIRLIQYLLENIYLNPSKLNNKKRINYYLSEIHELLTLLYKYISVLKFIIELEDYKLELIEDYIETINIYKRSYSTINNIIIKDPRVMFQYNGSTFFTKDPRSLELNLSNINYALICAKDIQNIINDRNNIGENQNINLSYLKKYLTRTLLFNNSSVFEVKLNENGIIDYSDFSSSESDRKAFIDYSDFPSYQSDRKAFLYSLNLYKFNKLNKVKALEIIKKYLIENKDNFLEIISTSNNENLYTENSNIKNYINILKIYQIISLEIIDEYYINTPQFHNVINYNSLSAENSYTYKEKTKYIKIGKVYELTDGKMDDSYIAEIYRNFTNENNIFTISEEQLKKNIKEMMAIDIVPLFVIDNNNATFLKIINTMKKIKKINRSQRKIGSTMPDLG